LRARDRLADSLFDSILLRLRSSPALPLPLPPSMLLSGLELRRDGDDMVRGSWVKNRKRSLFWVEGGRRRSKEDEKLGRKESEI
jgi:hypothetical protein